MILISCGSIHCTLFGETFLSYAESTGEEVPSHELIRGLHSALSVTRDLSVLDMVKLQLKVQIRTSRTGIPSHTTSSEVEAPSYELNRDLHSYLDMVKLQLKVNIQVRTTRTKGKFIQKSIEIH